MSNDNHELTMRDYSSFAYDKEGIIIFIHVETVDYIIGLYFRGFCHSCMKLPAIETKRIVLIATTLQDTSPPRVSEQGKNP
jgi:hypothetical protein